MDTLLVLLSPVLLLGLLFWERMDFYDKARVCSRCCKMERPSNQNEGNVSPWFCRKCSQKIGRRGWDNGL